MNCGQWNHVDYTGLMWLTPNTLNVLKAGYVVNIGETVEHGEKLYNEVEALRN